MRKMTHRLSSRPEKMKSFADPLTYFEVYIHTIYKHLKLYLKK